MGATGEDQTTGRGMPIADSGFILLADVSGFTSFLSDVADAHAGDTDPSFVPAAYGVFGGLVDLVVDAVAPPFELAKLEGDAVFAVASSTIASLDRPVPECLRGCYASFRGRLDEILATLSCRCRACARMGDLDLKFVLHHGTWVSGTIAGQTELLGPDVTLAHRLLKNSVTERTGLRAYALVTEPAATCIELDLGSLVGVEERYDHLPTVRAWVLQVTPGESLNSGA